ncbi:methionine synthase [Aeromicrobium sp. Root495]|uniref:methionine synthase n=1 Tax=Aeromicrobium sp. Root495 TaxID=1736550 RepID=UPI0006F5FB45|nr:methionine synthase [Aeromicrobium sp. Root495]KQY59646.1 methionine synthase [Aeromicrobium sp. Root495]
MRATGVGSMPGEDLHETLRVVRGILPELLFVPELPARGVHSGMIGRSLALLDGLSADLQPAGWRLLDSPGLDHRRARSRLDQDLDAVEEQWNDHDGTLKQQVAGPWTLAATVELQRGEKVLADHGARRDLAESLAVGIGEHVADLRRRTPGATVVVQVDEPMLPAVLNAQVRTASGFGRYRTVYPPEADAGLRAVADAVREAGGTPVLHSCAPDLPVELLAGAGFTALSFDLSLARADDSWAEAFESGLELWPGILPSSDETFDDAAALRRLAAWMDRLGFGEDAWHDRVVLTPTCGLAGATPAHARRALSALADIVGA